MLKLPPRKLEPWFDLRSFFFLRFLCIFINLPYDHVWNTVWACARSCYLELLDTLQKRICSTVGPSLAASIEPLAHRKNVARVGLFYKYYFGRCSCELAELVPLSYSRGRSTRFSDRLHNFPVTIPRCYTDVYVKSFFPCTARLWNFWPCS